MSLTQLAFTLVCYTAFSAALPLNDETCPTAVRCIKPQTSTFYSCSDYLRQGYVKNGYYKISLAAVVNSHLTVYCDLESEPGAAWTLVESFSFKNKGVEQFWKRTFIEDAKVNENSPNWNLYRMSHFQMNRMKQKSTHWRVTCSFPQSARYIYTDYARAKFSDFDVMTFRSHRVCKKMEFVNIRGHQCADCTVAWSAEYNGKAVRVESSVAKFWSRCDFDPSANSVRGEDNFGYYSEYSRKFRCSSAPESTTNWWFGGYY